MIDYHNTWRDRQLNSVRQLTADSVLLEQEQVMLNFVTRQKNAQWRWIAPKTKFYQICQQHIQVTDSDYNAVIIFGPEISDIDTATLVQRIKNFIINVDYAYVAINRYLITAHTLNTELPDSMEQSLDHLVSQADCNFARLASFVNVDGNHMVFAHPMDCFGLCR